MSTLESLLFYIAGILTVSMIYLGQMRVALWRIRDTLQAIRNGS
jgi:hypothetical protein